MPLSPLFPDLDGLDALFGDSDLAMQVSPAPRQDMANLSPYIRSMIEQPQPIDASGFPTLP